MESYTIKVVATTVEGLLVLEGCILVACQSTHYLYISTFELLGTFEQTLAQSPP